MLILAWILSFSGILLLLIAAIGVLRLPDSLSRQHAATKAATLSICLFLFGQIVFVIVSDWGWEWVVRLLLLFLLLLVTLPLASHALARSAFYEQTRHPIQNHFE